MLLPRKLTKAHAYQKHGSGTWKTSEGVYTGQFVFNAREGEGVMRYADGSVYEGWWKKDKVNSLHTVASSTYILTELFDRIATRTWYLHFRFFLLARQEVHWRGKSQMMIFLGTLRRAKFYNVQWASDKKHGKGEIWFANGNHFEGNFKRDMVCVVTSRHFHELTNVISRIRADAWCGYDEIVRQRR